MNKLFLWPGYHTMETTRIFQQIQGESWLVWICWGNQLMFIVISVWTVPKILEDFHSSNERSLKIYNFWGRSKDVAIRILFQYIIPTNTGTDTEACIGSRQIIKIPTVQYAWSIQWTMAIIRGEKNQNCLWCGWAGNYIKSWINCKK